MKSLEKVQAISDALVQKEIDNGNLTAMQGIHNIVEMNWKMRNKPWWVKEQISSDGYDSVKDAVDLLGTKNPHLSMTPYAEGEDNRQQAESIEQVLMWQMNKTLARRGAANKKATKQAFKYGRTCAQLIYLPWQFDALKTMGKDTKRQEIALQDGDFILKVFDAQDVFPYWTDYGLEAVLSRTVMTSE